MTVARCLDIKIPVPTWDPEPVRTLRRRARPTVRRPAGPRRPRRPAARRRPRLRAGRPDRLADPPLARGRRRGRRLLAGDARAGGRPRLPAAAVRAGRRARLDAARGPRRAGVERDAAVGARPPRPAARVGGGDAPRVVARRPGARQRRLAVARPDARGGCDTAVRRPPARRAHRPADLARPHDVRRACWPAPGARSTRGRRRTRTCSTRPARLGDDAVLTWVSGTGLRPVTDALADQTDLRRRFVDAYAARLRAAYPRRPWGTLLPFRRVFVVARVGGAA
nr:hypothetical protein [Angustibacter aerolatus]